MGRSNAYDPLAHDEAEESDGSEGSGPFESCEHRPGLDEKEGEKVGRENGGERKRATIAYTDLAKHGYTQTPSLLQAVDAPREKKDETLLKNQWQWSTRRESSNNETEAEREMTRYAATDAVEEQVRHAIAHAERQRATNEALKEWKTEKLTHNQREKRKRKRGAMEPDYVQEEKRAARHLGVYSGFDT